jgi:hypothetical protein
VRAIPIIAILAVLACGDSTGPESMPLDGRFLIRSIDGEATPTSITPPSWSDQTMIVAGVISCPAQVGSSAEEYYDVNISWPTNDHHFRLSYAVECEIIGTDQIRYTYPVSGESIVGQVWRGRGPEKGEVFQMKRFPSRETTEATLEWGMPFPHSAPNAIFRRAK